MKKYKITLKGISYEVEVEELDTDPAPAPAPRATSAAPTAETPAETEPPKACPSDAGSAPAAGATVVKAPIPGIILAVKVGPGQAVKKGTVLMILEAMKMANDIVSPIDGTVDVVAIGKGTSVNAGDILLSIQ